MTKTESKEGASLTPYAEGVSTHPTEDMVSQFAAALRIASSGISKNQPDDTEMKSDKLFSPRGYNSVSTGDPEMTDHFVPKMDADHQPKALNNTRQLSITMISRGSKYLEPSSPEGLLEYQSRTNENQVSGTQLGDSNVLPSFSPIEVLPKPLSSSRRTSLC